MKADRGPAMGDCRDMILRIKMAVRISLLYPNIALDHFSVLDGACSNAGTAGAPRLERSALTLALARRMAVAGTDCSGAGKERTGVKRQSCSH